MQIAHLNFYKLYTNSVNDIFELKSNSINMTMWVRIISAAGRQYNIKILLLIMDFQQRWQ